MMNASYRKLLICMASSCAAISLSGLARASSCTPSDKIVEYLHIESRVHVYIGCLEEINILDGLPKTFSKTGATIPQPTNQTSPGLKPVTRFFLEQKPNRSFFSRHLSTLHSNEISDLINKVGNPSADNFDYNAVHEGHKSWMYDALGYDSNQTHVSFKTDAYCDRGQAPVYRYFVNEGSGGQPAQHRFTAYWKSYQQWSSQFGVIGEEGIRMCAPLLGARLQIRDASITQGVSSASWKLSFKLLTANSVSDPNGYVMLSLPPGVQPGIPCTPVPESNYFRCGPYTAQPSNLAGLGLSTSVEVNLTGGDNLPGTWTAKLRAYATDPNLVQTEVDRIFNPEACTMADRPAYGCALAPKSTQPPNQGQNPNVDVTGLKLIGSVEAEPAGGRGSVTFNLVSSVWPKFIYYRLVQRVGSAGSWESLGDQKEITLNAAETRIDSLGFTGLRNNSWIAVCVSLSVINNSTLQRCGNDPSYVMSNAIGPYTFDSTQPSVSFFTVPDTLIATAGQFYSFSAYCDGNNLTRDSCDVRDLPSGLAVTGRQSLNGNARIRVNVSGTLSTNATSQNINLVYDKFSKSIFITVNQPAQQIKPVISNVQVGNIVSGSPNRADISFTLGAIPAVSGTTIYYWIIRTSGLSEVLHSGQVVSSGSNSVTASGVSFGSSHQSEFRICASTKDEFYKLQVCQTESPTRSLSAPVTINFGPPPPPPAAATANWSQLPTAADREVGKVSNWTLTVASADSANPLMGPVTTYVSYPSGFEFESVGSSSACTLTSTLRTLSCVVQVSGTLTSPVSLDLRFKLQPGSGGTSKTVIAQVVNNAPATPAPTASCASGAQGCAHGAIDVAFYDLKPQEANIQTPTVAQSVNLGCIAEGNAVLPTSPNDAKCRVEITYTDNSSEHIEQTYDAASRNRQFKLCAYGTSESGCSLTLVSGKTLKTVKIIAIDGIPALDNNLTNNSREVDVTTPAASCSDQVSESNFVYPRGRPNSYPWHFTQLANGQTYVIELTKHPSWKTVDFQPLNFVPYFQWAQASGYADRIVSLSRCRGHFTQGPDTPVVFSGYDGYQGKLYFVVDDPARKALTGAPDATGLSSNTNWYINIKQISCNLGPLCPINHTIAH